MRQGDPRECRRLHPAQAASVANGPRGSCFTSASSVLKGHLAYSALENLLENKNLRHATALQKNSLENQNLQHATSLEN